MIEPNAQTIDSYRIKGIRPCVVCCFVNDHKVMLAYKLEHDLWQIPQGGIENGESILDAIKRETLEELGLESPNEFSLVGEATLDFPKKTHGVKELKTDAGQNMLMTGKHYFYCALALSDPNFNVDTSQFDKLVWLNYLEAKNLLIGSDTSKLPGKRRITLDTLNSLYKEKWIN